MTSTTSQGQSQSGMVQDVAHQAMEMGERAMDAASEAGVMAAQTAREYPITTALLIAGVAFTLGALWKTGASRRRPSSMYGYMDRLTDAVNDQLPRRMRF